MHTHDIRTWQHPHDFITDAEARAERRTRLVVALTLVTMVVELTAGWLTGSMALLADGWHMGSHAAALSISAFAYYFARQRRGDRRFTFGTGKVSTLVTHRPRPVDHYRALIAQVPGIVHLTVEVNQCRDEACGNQVVTSNR